MTTSPWAHPEQLPVVAVAASAGGVEALKHLVATLPPDLPAVVLVALHLPPSARSMLAHILGREAALPVEVAQHGVPLRAGRVLVAPPDNHLLVRGGAVALGHGPRENGHRPSHDAMLRSVALAAGPRAVGVVLTGLLDDGAAGLAAVRRYGGTCVVQDPDDAEFASMPLAALAAVPLARSLQIAAVAAELVRTVCAEPARAPGVAPAQRDLDEAEVRSAEHGSPLLSDRSVPGTPSPFSCPDCSGVLNVVPDDALLRFRCRTGHAWNAGGLVSQQQERVEEALWVALRVLEERADLSNRLAVEARDGRRDWSSTRHAQRAEEAERSIAVIKQVLSGEVAVPDRTAAPSEP